MKMHPFIRPLTIVAALAAAGATDAAQPGASASGKVPAQYRVNGYVVACQAWTFNRFSVFEAIEKTAQTGAKAIEFFPGQKLSPEQPDVKFDHNSPPDIVAKVKAKLAQHGIKAVNYGVVGIPKDEAEARQVFAFATQMGMAAVTTESVDALDTIEKLAKEFDIKVGIHNHPKRANDPNYKVWDPAYILSIVKDRDARLGAAADTGHWNTSGVKALEGIALLKGRIVSLHMKDRAEFGKQTPDVPFGTGVNELGAVLDALDAQGFDGNISIEYEADWDNNVPKVAECVAFFRNHKPKKR